MADSRAAGMFRAFTAAARSPDGVFVVAMVDADERERLAKAFSAEGKVVSVGRFAEASQTFADRRVEIGVLDPGRDGLDVDPLIAIEEISPGTEVVLVVDPDTQRMGELFARSACGILPRPFPESDALLRAHVRWLVAGRRSRLRGLKIRSVLERHRAELLELEPALVAVLDRCLVREAGAPDTRAREANPIRVRVLGDAEMARTFAAGSEKDSPEVLVVAASEGDGIDARLAECRRLGAGGAMIVIDAAPSPARACAALYGGARAYLSRDQLPLVADVIKKAGARRRAEVEGRQLIEELARFGVFDDAPAGPMPSMEGGKAAFTDSATRSGAFVPSGHEILVVDDEIVVLTVLREALRRGGYRVTTAASAEEAIEILRKKAFDLVLTDKNLSGASGLDVLRFTRTLNPPPAVVLITGYSSYDSAVEALEIGALDYIEKPIRDVEQLRQRIRRALNRRDEQLSQASTETTQPGLARVLLVEVEEEKRKLLAEFLKRTFKVVSVADGDEALARLKKERFDVVLADRNLPGMMGLRVIEQAQSLLPHCACVLYTAYPTYDSVKEAFEVGADAYVVRPNEDLKALEQKISGALRSKGGILLG